MADRAQKGQNKQKAPVKGPVKAAKKPGKKGGNDDREETFQAVVRIAHVGGCS
jgi:hypothetical protein